MKFRAAVALACGFAVPSGAGADVLIEPLQFGGVHLDALYTTVAGVEGRAALRLGLGMTFVVPHGVQLGLAVGRSSTHTDFGLLAGPPVRLERADTSVEVRWRVPFEVRGFAAQAGLGLGRLALRYHPQQLRLELGGESYEVRLHEIAEWTRHVTGEIVHALPARAQIALRAVWTFYSLDVATPAGEERRAVRDVQSSVLLRVPMW